MTNSNIIGKRIIELSTCHSTNDYSLKKINENQLSEGDVVYADEQTHGKGQKGNVWETESGSNLTLSYILEPVFLKPAYQFELTVVVSLGMIDLLRKYNIDAFIKWPNDIYVGTKKIAGILIENKIKGSKLGYSIVGVGLNVNQEVFEIDSAVSMKQIAGEEFSLMELLLELSRSIEFYYGELKKGIDLRPIYYERLIGINKELLFDDGQQFRSEVVSIDDYGALVLSKFGEEMKYGVKEVKFLEL